MQQPSPAFFLFRDGERKTLRPEVSCQNLAAWADGEPERTWSCDQLVAFGRNNTSAGQNGRVAPNNYRSGASRCSKVTILKHQREAVHYKQWCGHRYKRPVGFINVRRNPESGTIFAQEFPSEF